MGHEGRVLRVLIVEDEALIALDVEYALQRHGHLAVGPAGSVAEARRLILSSTLDAAILDINLGGEEVFPVADALVDRGIPFLFMTGYGSAVLPPRHGGRLVATKPFPADRLIVLLNRTLSSAEEA